MESFTKCKNLHSLPLACILLTTYLLCECRASVQNENGNECIGKHQKPLDEKRLPIQFLDMHNIEATGFQDQPTATILENNGQTLVITMNFSGPVPSISKGVLDEVGTFRFGQIYLHWLEKSHPEYHNAEYQFPIEVHVVFYNDEYSSIKEALHKAYGIAIMAYSVQIHPKGSAYYSEIADELVNVREPNSKISLDEEQLLPLKLYTMPDLVSYWSYYGSLMSNICATDVIWIDYEFPLVLQPYFAEEVKKLRTLDKKPLMRQVVKAFEPVGVVVRVTGITDVEENVHSSIPFVDTIGNRAGLTFIKVGVFVLSCVMLLIF